MTDTTDRRRFLRILAEGGAAVGCVALGVGCAAGPSGTFSGGNVSDLAVPSLKVVQGESVAVGRDERGVYALSLICTHASCDMSTQGSVGAGGIVCYCHGSEFDAEGNVVSGPASSPLEHYLVTIDAAGAITIDADQTVSESTRATPKG